MAKKRKKAAPKKQPRKVMVCGKAPSGLAVAPFQDTSWEVWILNTMGVANDTPRWDRLFDLHDFNTYHRKQPEHAALYAWLQQQTKPIYVREHWPEVPGAVVYPREAVQKEFGGYFTNSVSWMIALALHEGLGEGDDLGVYGVDMAQHAVGVKSEYAHQRPSCEYFLGIAVGRGVKVTIPAESDLLKSRRLYGFGDDGMTSKFLTREKELHQRIEQARQRKQQAEYEENFLSGAVEDLQYVKEWL